MKGDTLMSSFLSEDFPKDKLSQPKYSVKVEKDVLVRMRDGVTVAVDIFRPDAPGKFPALYASSPYQKNLVYLPSVPAFHERETNQIEWFVERGYVYVHADIRGSGVSEGMWRFHSIEEQRDHYDLIEWMAQQEWCTGKVGMIGESYYAWVQWFAAAMQPPHLATIVPFDGGADMYRDVVFHGGLLNMSFVTWWHFNMRAQRLMDIPGPFPQDPLKPDTLKWDMVYEVLRHPTYDAFWKERTPNFNKIKCPVYSVGIWHKAALHLRGNIVGFEEIEAPKKLLVCHGDYVGQEMFIFESLEMRLELLRWYDHWLKGIDTGMMKDPPIKLFVRNSDEGYRAEKEWPLDRTQYTSFYLQPGRTGAALSLNDGGLSLRAPTAGESYFEFEYPNRDWMNWRGGGVATRVNGMLHPTGGIMTFTSAPLEEDLEVTGPIRFLLYASSSERDADFYLRVVDEAPDAEQLKGYPPKARMLTWGWLKASHRSTDPTRSKSYRPWRDHENPEPIEPGKIYLYEIEVMPTSNLFRRGHRIRIDFSNGDSWMFDSAHHYGLKYGKDRIYHDREHPSHLVLPVIPK